MNQILYKCKLENIPNANIENRRNFITIFSISISLLTIAILLYFIMKYNFAKNSNISQNIVSNFNIKTLYSDNTNYNSSLISAEDYSEPFVIGLIEIEKINIVYPILSTSSEDLLKLSPCRFAGPMPNEFGNLCIAGHNYANNTHFGKIDVLNKGDLIKIYDVNGNFLIYKIYDIYETKYNDLSCTNQNTNGMKEITLITCNNINGNRIVVKARANKK